MITFLTEMPSPLRAFFAVVYGTAFIAAVWSLTQPFPELWTYYPQRWRSKVAQRMTENRMTPLRTTMSPQGRAAQRIADAHSLGTIPPTGDP